MEGGGRVELFEESVDIVLGHTVFMKSAWRCIIFWQVKLESREVFSQYMTYFYIAIASYMSIETSIYTDFENV